MSSASAAPAAGNDTIYVNNSHGNDSWDGLTWETAKLTIKNATKTVNNGGTVNIGEGTYSGAGNTGITLTKDMTINGAGIDKTIISGLDSTRIFLINSGTVNINNLTITNGKSNNGGGICNYGTLTIDKCKFTNCTTYYGYMCGGSAIYNGEDGTLTVKNSIFTQNDARLSTTGGGTIFTCGPLSVENSEFIGNQAYAGGAIYILYDNNANINGCNFINNTAINSGGVFCIYSGFSTVSIHSSSFVGNTARSTAFTNNIDNRLNSNLDISSNWWATNTGVNGVSGPYICDNWIYMTLTGNSPINYGENSAITANFNNLYNGITVTPYNTHMPDGNSVTFSTDHGTVNPTQSVTNNGLAQTSLTGASVGTANVTAISGTQLLSVTININQASTLITVNNTTGINNQTTNLTATLTDSNGNPLKYKEVNFTVNGTSVGTANTDSNGVATLTYKPTQAGDFVLTGSFAGDSDYLASTGSGNLHVDPSANLYMDTTTINSNPSAGQEFLITYKLGNYGPDAAENVTITFTIPEGLDYVDVSADSGICSYNPTTRMVTWTLFTVPKGDPYLYLRVKATSAGTYTLTPTINTPTFNWKTGNQGIFNINVSPAKSFDNNANTVNAATQTVAMQTTGANPMGLVLAILAILGGTLLPRKK